jgi:hypothetical protein
MKKVLNDGPQPARICYGHIGSKLGELLTATFIEKAGSQNIARTMNIITLPSRSSWAAGIRH